jgi:hypothetical protein
MLRAFDATRKQKAGFVEAGFLFACGCPLPQRRAFSSLGINPYRVGPAVSKSHTQIVVADLREIKEIFMAFTGSCVR